MSPRPPTLVLAGKCLLLDPGGSGVLLRHPWAPTEGAPTRDNPTVRWVREHVQGEVWTGDLRCEALAEAAGLSHRPAPPVQVRPLRTHPWAGAAAWDRATLLELARVRLKEQLSSPAETIVTLSREGDRLERLIHRDAEALRALGSGAVPGGSVASYLELAREPVVAGEARLAALERSLHQSTVRLLPNTCALVGSRTAARLLACAGTPEALVRMGASHLQLLGTRRRAGPLGGSKHGVIYRADGMNRVPPERRGALARSLASLLPWALRADLLTHGSLGPRLVQRRERRISQLNRIAGAQAAKVESPRRGGRP